MGGYCKLHGSAQFQDGVCETCEDERRPWAVDELPIVNPDEPDIGMCDACGSEDGRRRRRVVTATLNGVVERVVTWLCADCVAERKAS